MTYQNPCFTREDFLRQKESGRTKLIHSGRLFNADVYRLTYGDHTWIVKDFADRPFYVRWIARALLAHEVTVLKRLKGVPDLSRHVFRLDAAALASEFLPGTSLLSADPRRITPEFLRRLEALTRRMHRAGVVHLDLRSLTNVIIDAEGTPGIIDFQSALVTDHLPRRLVRTLRAIDLSGACKKWQKFQPEAMGPVRRRFFHKINRIRRWWVFKGYLGLKSKKRHRHS